MNWWVIRFCFFWLSNEFVLFCSRSCCTSCARLAVTATTSAQWVDPCSKAFSVRIGPIKAFPATLRTKTMSSRIPSRAAVHFILCRRVWPRDLVQLRPWTRKRKCPFLYWTISSMSWVFFSSLVFRFLLNASTRSFQPIKMDGKKWQNLFDFLYQKYL